MSRTVLFTILAAALFCTGLVPASHASVVQYTDRTAWTDASSGLTSEDFTGLGGSYDSLVGLTIGPVNFVGHYNDSTRYLRVRDDLGVAWSTGAVLMGPPYGGASSRLEIIFSGGGYNSVGFDIMAYSGGSSVANLFTVDLSTGAPQYNVTTIADFGSRAFLGFTSDVPITGLTIKPTDSGYITLDNFGYGAQGTPPEPVPESSTWLLCAAGLLLLLGRKHTLAPLLRRIRPPSSPQA